MPRIQADRPVDPTTLSPSARDQLARDLFAVQDQIFAGVSFDEFRGYMVDSPAQRTRIQCFRDAETRAVVGYAATHVFTLEVAGETVDLMRAEVGLLPAWRGQSVAGTLLLTEGARLAARSMVRPAFFLACPVHPASYLAAARGSQHLWPRPERTTPPEVQFVMDQLDATIGLTRPVDAVGAGVRKVGWTTRQDAAEQAYWAERSDDLVRYYVEQNPGYTRGDGLLVVAPVSLTSVVDAASTLARRQWARMYKRIKSPAGSRGLRRRLDAA